MLTITREQAICMFYCEKYNDENVAELIKRIDEMKDVDICYTEDPTEPFLVFEGKINQNPYRFHTYQSKNILLPTITKEPLEDKEVILGTYAIKNHFSWLQII
jgi:hypothetical protein